MSASAQQSPAWMRCAIVGKTFSPDDVISTCAAHGNRGIAYKNKGDYDKTIADYRKVLEINPADAKAYHALGNAYSAKGDHDRAIADYSRAIALDPKNVMAYANRSTPYTSKGDFDRAITDGNKTIELDPKYAFACFNRGTKPARRHRDYRTLIDRWSCAQTMHSPCTREERFSRRSASARRTSSGCGASELWLKVGDGMNR